MVTGIQGSFGHNQNGMTFSDMAASLTAADRLNEVIIFRSTGPWAKRWLKRGYPSKNFHVKGKSSDWGPHAGLVPYDGIWSKVGYNDKKAEKGTDANKDGLASGFAGKELLVLTMAQIDEQLNDPEGAPPRTAISGKYQAPGSKDLMLTCRRSGDQRQVVFRAKALGGDRFGIYVYKDAAATKNNAVSGNAIKLADSDKEGKLAVPLEVMTSREVGAGKPMTGDYDLFAVCPSWADYGSLTRSDIVKPGIQLDNGELRKGLAFRAGVGMDNVLDTRLHTMGKSNPKGLNPTDYGERNQIIRNRMRNGQTGPLSPDSLKVLFDGSPYTEHGDMGNLTPRILRCINELNVQMGAVGANAALRRVHHNAESHRFRQFGALTGQDMITKKDGEQYGDGFPLTVFQPASLLRNASTLRYTQVCTLESLEEFKVYAKALAEAGYYVPKNWIWGI